MLKLKSLQFLYEESVRTFRRFPLVLLSALAATVLAIYYAELDVEFPRIQPVFTCLLGLPLFLSLTLFLESRRIEKLLTKALVFAGGVLFLGLFHYLTAGNTRESYILQYLQLSLALHLLVSFSSHIGNPDEAGFWELNKVFFIRILTSFVYAAAFFLGLVAALVTTSKLFALDIKSVRYAELFFFSAITLQTWHFLAGVPRGAVAAPAPYPRSLKYLIQYLLIPLVSLYTLILYVYMAKILITNSWPEGYVGWLVSIMSVLGIFNLLLIHPEKFKPESKWLSTYSRAYYILILPLLGMLFIAIGKRIAEYGVTEKRYFLLVLGLWLFLTAVYFIFSRAKKIKIIPVGLFFVALMTLWSPMNAYRVSLDSQMGRARAILEHHHVSTSGPLAPPAAEVSRADQTNLSSIFDYVLRTHGREPLENWFSSAALNATQPDPQASRYVNAKPLMAALGLNYYLGGDDESHFSYHTKSDSAFRIGGYQYAARFSGKSSDIDLGGRELKLALASDFLVLNEGAKELARIDLLSVLEKIQKREGGTDHEIPRELMAVENAGGPAPFILYLDNMNGRIQDGKTDITFVSGWILFR